MKFFQSDEKRGKTQRIERNRVKIERNRIDWKKIYDFRLKIDGLKPVLARGGRCSNDEKRSPRPLRDLCAALVTLALQREQHVL